MPTLGKLLDCLKWPKVAASGRPVGPNPQLQLVADPEVAFGWQGNLFAQQTLATQAIAANTVGASVTIPDDCFYIIDATQLYMDNISLGQSIIRIALEILDPSGNIVYQLAQCVGQKILTAVGFVWATTSPFMNMRMHLSAGMIVRWKTLDAQTGSGAQWATSLSIRKLYEENL